MCFQGGIALSMLSNTQLSEMVVFSFLDRTKKEMLSEIIVYRFIFEICNINCGYKFGNSFHYAFFLSIHLHLSVIERRKRFLIDTPHTQQKRKYIEEINALKKFTYGSVCFEIELIDTFYSVSFPFTNIFKR